MAEPAPPPVTIREQIMQALLTRAQTYLPGATRASYRGGEVRLPRLSLLDTEETRLATEYKRDSFRLAVAADWAAVAEEDASTLANEHIGQLVLALRDTDGTLDGICDGMAYEGSTTVHPGPAETVIGVQSRFSIFFTVAAGDPFNP